MQRIADPHGKTHISPSMPLAALAPGLTPGLLAPAFIPRLLSEGLLAAGLLRSFALPFACDPQTAQSTHNDVAQIGKRT